MKLVLISDTHDRHKALDGFMPDGDILIHSGDLTIDGSHDYVKRVGEWLSKLPYKHKLVIAGNHDWQFERNPVAAKVNIGHGENGVTYLQDEEIVIDGVKFYGSPWQPTFFNWAFNLDRGTPIKAKWDLIPNDTDVLITHGPPMGFLDEAWDSEYDVQTGKKVKFRNHVGCRDLMDAINRVRPSLNVFGHIHACYGFKHFNGTSFVNASICDEAYRPTRQPFEWEIS